MSYYHNNNYCCTPCYSSENYYYYDYYDYPSQYNFEYYQPNIQPSHYNLHHNMAEILKADRNGDVTKILHHAFKIEEQYIQENYLFDIPKFDIIPQNIFGGAANLIEGSIKGVIDTAGKAVNTVTSGEILDKAAGAISGLTDEIFKAACQKVFNMLKEFIANKTGIIGEKILQLCPKFQSITLEQFTAIMTQSKVAVAALAIPGPPGYHLLPLGVVFTTLYKYCTGSNVAGEKLKEIESLAASVEQGVANLSKTIEQGADKLFEMAAERVFNMLKSFIANKTGPIGQTILKICPKFESITLKQFTKLMEDSKMAVAALAVPGPPGYHLIPLGLVFSTLYKYCTGSNAMGDKLKEIEALANDVNKSKEKLEKLGV